MCATLVAPAFAMGDETIEDDIPCSVIVVDSRGLTEEEREANFQAFLQSRMDEICGANGARGNLGYSKTETGTKKTQNFNYEPDGQPTNGYRSIDGDGFVNIIEGGGEPESITFSAGVAGKVLSFSVSIPIGRVVSGSMVGSHSVRIPGSPASKPVFYRVHEYATYSLQPYVIFWRQTSLDPWTVADTGTYVECIDLTFGAIRVA